MSTSADKWTTHQCRTCRTEKPKEYLNNLFVVPGMRCLGRLQASSNIMGIVSTHPFIGIIRIQEEYMELS